MEITPANAAAYIVDHHASHGGAVILSSVLTDIDGFPCVEVRFTFNGRAECATCWIESGEVYGEW